MAIDGRCAWFWVNYIPVLEVVLCVITFCGGWAVKSTLLVMIHQTINIEIVVALITRDQ